MLSPTAATAAASASAEPVPKHTYHAFMAKMQQPSASGLFRSIKLFVRDLLSDTQRSVDEVAEAVQAFFYETEEAIAQHPLWHGCEPEELDKACDALEKFVTTKLYDKVFLTDAEERENDRLLEERLQHLRFVTVEHLSVSPAFCAAYPWAGAQQELCKLAAYRTPRDKLVCVLNCCKRINSSLSVTSAGSHGADEFFPVLIFVLLQACPPQLHANLQYISRFRHPSKLVSEAAYYLTHMQSAASFVLSLTAEQLSIEQADFQQLLAKARAAAAEERAAAAREAAAQQQAAAQQEAAAAQQQQELQEAAAAELAAAAAERGRASGGDGSDEAGAPVAARAPQLPPQVPPRRPGRNRPRAVPRQHFVAVAVAPLRRDAGGAVTVELALSVCAGDLPSRPEGPAPSLRFLATQGIEELAVGDLSQLLSEYTWLSHAIRRLDEPQQRALGIIR
jgi:hypothetical protein